MDAFFESTMLAKYELYCMKHAHKWLREHGFESRKDIAEVAIQCARIGFLRYIREIGAEKEEDLFKGHCPYWQIFEEVYKGVVMQEMNRGGFHRSTKAVKKVVRFEFVPLDGIVNSISHSYRDDPKALDRIELQTFVRQLPKRHRDVFLLLLKDMRRADIAKRLRITERAVECSVQAIRRKWERLRCV